MRQRVLVVPGSMDGASAQEIVERLGVFPAEVARGLLDAACLESAGRRIEDPHVRLPQGTRLMLTYDPHTHYRPRPEPRRGPGCTIVYEDPDFLVVDKDSGFATEPELEDEPEGGSGPAAPVNRSSLVERLAAAGSGIGLRADRSRGLFAVHRLEPEASGLLVIARRIEALWGLVPQFDGSTARRSFTAVVSGTPADRRGTLRPAPVRRRRTARRQDPAAEVRRAVTRWSVEENLPGATVLRVETEGGRVDRIVAALDQAGIRLMTAPETAGDTGGPDSLARLALHCGLLEFEDPVRTGRLTFRSPLPREIERLLAKLRGETVLDVFLAKPDRAPAGKPVDESSGRGRSERLAKAPEPAARPAKASEPAPRPAKASEPAPRPAKASESAARPPDQTARPARRAPRAAWLKKREATREDPTVPDWVKEKMGLRPRRTK